MKKTYWQKSKKIVGPNRVAEFDTAGQQGTRKKIHEMIISLSDENSKVLEIGCNVGMLPWQLHKKGYKGSYTGVDSNGNALVLAAENTEGLPEVEFLEGEAEDLPFGGCVADIVVSKDVIEHLETYKKALAEFARVCAKYFLLSMFIIPQDEPEKIVLTPSGYYLNTYNRSELIAHVVEQGFELVRSEVVDSDELFLFERRDA